MIIDFRQLENRSEIKSDICIIGAGAAGITIARALGGTGIRVCLLESGGFEYDEKIQSLYSGETRGVPYWKLELARLRYFGGSTNHWGGWCGPLDESDFEARPWIPYSGWPIRRQDLDPYYQRAQALCELGPQGYDIAAWENGTRRFPAFLPAKLHAQLWQFSPPTRFGTVYRREIKAAGNIRAYLYANVTRLETDENATQVIGARIRTPWGQTGTVRARYFVLACGGIENARILLLSNQHARAGLGNDYDRVGRFFMEHPMAQRAVRLFTRELATIKTLFEPIQNGGQHGLAGLCPTPIAQRARQILNCSATFSRILDPYADPDKDAWPNDMLGTMMDLDDGRRREGAFFYLTTRSEQAPNPDSRITLSDERDTLGLNKAILDWQLTDIDFQTIRTSLELIGEELGRLGLGRVQLADWLTTTRVNWSDSLNFGSHHMGTTRMTEDPKQGVVDRNCRVHSVANLYVAGSSVFTTSGYMNPTLTIVALALRLADHLKEQVKGQ